MLSLRLLLMCIGAYAIPNANVSDLKVMFNVLHRGNWSFRGSVYNWLVSQFFLMGPLELC